LTAQINNDDGTIGGNAAINMNLSRTAIITNAATMNILAVTPHRRQQSNLNGGNYNAGADVLSRSTATNDPFNMHRVPDFIKPAYSALTVSQYRRRLSADRRLKLYAPGSGTSLTATHGRDGAGFWRLFRSYFNNVVSPSVTQSGRCLPQPIPGSAARHKDRHFGAQAQILLSR
jgi:hypothetical protein